MCQMSKIRFSLYLVNEKQDSTFVFLFIKIWKDMDKDKDPQFTKNVSNR